MGFVFFQKIALSVFLKSVFASDKAQIKSSRVVVSLGNTTVYLYTVACAYHILSIIHIHSIWTNATVSWCNVPPLYKSGLSHPHE